MNAIVTLWVSLPFLVKVLIILIGVAVLVPVFSGSVMIQEREVGVVVKRFGSRSLPPGRLIALDGEAGYPAQTLSPGLHFGYFFWQYHIQKVPVVIVPQGEIALVIAADGAATENSRRATPLPCFATG